MYSTLASVALRELMGTQARAGAHQAEHAEEHAGVVGGIDGGAVFIAQAFGAHGAGDCSVCWRSSA